MRSIIEVTAEMGVSGAPGCGRAEQSGSVKRVMNSQRATLGFYVSSRVCRWSSVIKVREADGEVRRGRTCVDTVALSERWSVLCALAP